MRKPFLIFLLGMFLFACKNEENTVIRMETSLGVIRFRLYNETRMHQENMRSLVRDGYYNGMLFHRVLKDFTIQMGDPDSKMARTGILLGDKDIGYTFKEEISSKYFHKRGAIAAARASDNINPQRNSSGSHFYIVQGKIFSADTLEKDVEVVNNKRYIRLFNKLKTEREGEIARSQLAGNYEALMQINKELSEATRTQYEKVKLQLSEEQIAAYTTVGGTPHLDGEYTVFGEVIEGLDIIGVIAGMETDEHFRPRTNVVINKMIIE